MQNHLLEAGVFVVTMGVPTACLQINFHIPGRWLFVPNLQDRAAKIRSTFMAHKTGMNDADGPAIAGL